MATARGLHSALVSTTRPGNVTVQECGYTAVRWLHNDCRCGVGAFDGGWTASPSDHPCAKCGKTDIPEWNTYFEVATSVVFVMFLVPFFWSCMRIIRLCRALGWPGLQATVNLQAMTHVLCLIAASLRLLLVLVEKHATDHVKEWMEEDTDPHSTYYYGQFDFMVYSFFYPAVASTILCMCYYWQLHLNTFREPLDSSEPFSLSSNVLNALNESSANWQWVGPIRVASALFALELFHDIVALMVPSKELDTFFNMWGAFSVFIAAVFSLITALKLHAALCESAPYNATGAIFKKLKVGPITIVVLSALMFILVLCEIFHNQWYAWPHLLDWVTGRTIEAVMLATCLGTIGYVQQPPQNSALSFQESTLRVASGERGGGQSHHAELGPLAFAPPMDRGLRQGGQ